MHRFHLHHQCPWHPRTVLCILLLAARSAMAEQATGDKVTSEALFQQARKLMADGDYASACPRLIESQRLDPAVGTLMYLGLCFEQTGKTASAWSTYLSAESAARNAQQLERARIANERAKALQPRLVRLTIRVAPEAASLSGLVIQRDGSNVGQTVWSEALPVDPGEHTVLATAPGYVPWSARVNVDPQTAAGDSGVVIEVPMLAATQKQTSEARRLEPPASAPSVQDPPRDQPVSSRNGRLQRASGVGLGALGAASMALGAFFAIRSKTKDDQASKHCGSSIGAADPLACDGTGMKLNDQATSASNAATWSLLLGGGALLSGAILYLTAPKGVSTSNAQLLIVPSLGVGAVACTISGKY